MMKIKAVDACWCGSGVRSEKCCAPHAAKNGKFICMKCGQWHLVTDRVYIQIGEDITVGSKVRKADRRFRAAYCIGCYENTLVDEDS